LHLSPIFQDAAKRIPPLDDAKVTRNSLEKSRVNPVICVEVYPPSWTTWGLAVLVAGVIFAAGFGLGVVYGPVIVAAVL